MRGPRRGLSQAEAAEVLGVSERTFRRWRDRYGPRDRASTIAAWAAARRAPRVLELFAPLLGLHAKHFHEKLVAAHGCVNWLRLTLQASRRAAPRRGAHRASAHGLGMMVHQDGSEWVSGRWWDLIVTMDEPAFNGLLRRSFRALSEVVAEGCSARFTPTAPRPLGTRPRPAAPSPRTPRGRALAPIGIELAPEARGRRAHVRHLAEAPAPGTQARGITDMAGFRRSNNARFATPAEGQGSCPSQARSTTCPRDRVVQRNALSGDPADPARPPSTPLRQGGSA